MCGSTSTFAQRPHVVSMVGAEVTIGDRYVDLQARAVGFGSNTEALANIVANVAKQPPFKEDFGLVMLRTVCDSATAKKDGWCEFSAPAAKKGDRLPVQAPVAPAASVATPTSVIGNK